MKTSEEILSKATGIQAYNPTLRERYTRNVANLLRDKFGMDNYKAVELTQGIFGNPNAESILDQLGATTFSPAEAVFGGQEGAREFKRADDLVGKGIGAATVGLSALEAFPATALMAKGIKRMFPKASPTKNVDLDRRKVTQGIAALPIAATGIAKVIGDLPMGAATATKAAAKTLPEVTGSSLLDNLPFVQNTLRNVFYLTKDSPKGDLQGIYHLNELKTELEGLAGMPRLAAPSSKNKEKLLDKPLDDFMIEVDSAKRELVDLVEKEGDAGEALSSPITLELLEDFMDLNQGMTLRKAIEKVDDEINTVLKSKNIDNLYDVDPEPGFLVDMDMQRELAISRPSYMGAPMKNPDPYKTFRVDPDAAIARNDFRYEVRVASGDEPKTKGAFEGMTLDEIEATTMAED
jgi:hypothetical protein